MPFAFVVMLVGVFAISGVPGFSGFFSKDAVIYGALKHGHPWLYAAGVVTAGITAYYMFRLLFITFLGDYRGDVDATDLGIRRPHLLGATAPESAPHEPHKAHAPDWIMNVPVGILIVPSILAGWLLVGAANGSPWSRFFASQFASAPAVAPGISETATSVLVLVVVAIGFAVAYWRYATPAAQADAVARLHSESLRMPAILTNLFYFDAMITLVFVRTSQLFGTIFGRVVDPYLIDGTVRETVFASQWLGTLVRSLQTGLVRAYALVLVFGAACFIVYYAWLGGAR
jgi:NADH:ubiquinone oxidoreductase subunit 5 (subunit L)/multisubunit Na+/H+ antiporter MnhA subunit